ncbi:MAG: nuclear transport factor 2 family protein [Pseudomonadales bacterium]
MKRIISCLGILLVSFSAMAEHHAKENSEQKQDENAALHAAIKAFDRAYATNDVEAYFGLYAKDAVAYFGGKERVDMAAYHKMWSELMKAGGGVEHNVASNVQVQVMPSGNTAIATSFIENRTRAADGKTSTSTAYETDVWQKIDGQWKIISLHYSDIPAED